MIKWLAIGFTSLIAVQAFAEECLYRPPATMDLPYQEGAYLPVYFSHYQFNLPSKPEALLSGDGFIASYPERGYIGQQPVDVKPWREGVAHGNLPVGIADAYRALYGASSTDKLNNQALAEVMFQRSLLKLDCKAHVTFYRVGGAVDVIWQERQSADGFHTIWVLGDKSAELITMRRPNEDVLQVIASIKPRR
jgi:hypothetical protein